MEFPQAKLLIFAKAPIAGQVKTRLIPTLSAEQAAQLHAKLVMQTLSIATAAKLCPVELYCASNIQHPFFKICQERFNITRQQQSDGNLGQRMSFALRAALTDAHHVLIIGTDCPPLNSDVLHQALSVLNSRKDAVIAPAEDGGYVLIGARKHSPILFENIDWGTNTVLIKTRQRLKKLNWDYAELDTLWDLDRPNDLIRYQTFNSQHQNEEMRTKHPL